jgi:phospholipase C
MNNNQDIFHQPDPLRADGGFLLPWRVDTSKVDGQDLGGTPHDWNSTHAAWNNGLWSPFPPFKSALSMSYFGASDIPFQRALAQAFTVCDNNFCSVLGPTSPNRLYLMTGTIDPDGQHGGPCAANPNDYVPVFSWTTYPERLQEAGISWQVYANDEVGDGNFPNDAFVGDFGDNMLWLFQQYHAALASKDPKVHQLAERASLHVGWKPNAGLGKNVNHVLSQFIADCQANTLPAVSWIVGPYAYTEHPVARPVDGAAYMQGVLNAVWANPKLAASTVVIINYDENDGFFDHIPPPTAPPGTPGEFLPAFQPGFRGSPQPFGPPVPIGLGVRVPMIVVSPWSHGGWVNSQVFDHTSVLRFLEVWTGVHEPNISAWRRAICGDLTSCFDFEAPRFSVPMLPDTAKLRLQADQTESKLPPATPPLPGQQTVPVQDGGTGLARPLPYQPLADLVLNGGQLVAHMSNHGTAALQLSVFAHHPLGETAQRFDLHAGGSATASVAPDALTGAYDVWIHGPNGFVRHASGSVLTEAGVEAELGLVGDREDPQLKLTLRNVSAQTQTVHVTGLHHSADRFELEPHDVEVLPLNPLANNHGWYDLVVSVVGQPHYTRLFAGHLENGEASRTEPNQ